MLSSAKTVVFLSLASRRAVTANDAVTADVVAYSQVVVNLALKSWSLRTMCSNM